MEREKDEEGLKDVPRKNAAFGAAVYTAAAAVALFETCCDGGLRGGSEEQRRDDGGRAMDGANKHRPD